MDAQLAELPLMPESPDSPASPDELFWLGRAQAGDAEGFRQLLRAHQSRVYSIALRFLGRRADAEELAQDVFVQLHGVLERIETPAHLKHWLLRTVSHRSIDRLRQQQRRPQLVSVETLGEAGAATAAGIETDPLAIASLRRLVLGLAPDARAVVLLRFQEDLDPADIAAALGMPVNTVKSHLRRSLEWLRAQVLDEKEAYTGAAD